MNNIMFISETAIKDFSLLDNNLSYSYIYPSLKFVQDKYMTSILGIKLYNEIRTQVKNNNLTSDNKILLDDYIKYILLWGVMSEIQVPLNYKFRNQGYVSNSNEDGNNLLLDDIKYTKQFYQNTTYFYVNQLIEYLNTNKSKYPNYTCKVNKKFSSPIVI